MHHVLLVEHLERDHQRERERHRFGDGHRSPRHPSHECLALQVLHDQEVHEHRLRRLVTSGGVSVSSLSVWERAGVRALWNCSTDVVQRTDVRVVRGGDGLGLALKPLLQGGIGRKLLGQHLDGNGAVKAGVAGLVDLTHTARTEGGLDRVGAKAGAWREGHGCQGRAGAL